MANITGYLSATVADTAGTLPGLASATVDGASRSFVGLVETAPIRMRADGTAPTTTEGELLVPGQRIVLTEDEIFNAQFIRTGATSGVVRGHFYSVAAQEISGQVVFTGGAQVDSDSVISGNTPNTYKHAFVNATETGNTQVVAAVASKKIRVHKDRVGNKGGAVMTVKFQSATTDITAAYDIAADGGGFNMSGLPAWLYETSTGAALNVNLSATGAVGVDVWYTEVS